MRAVNLVPSDLRRAGAGGGSGSGTGAYALLGALALVLVLVAAFSITTRSVNDKQAEVDRLNAEAQAAEAQAANLSGYKAVVDAANTRRTAVVELIEARFDWARALEDVSRTVPDGVSLTSIIATVAPGVSVGSGGGGTSNALRPSVAAPAIEIAGCTPSQAATAALISRLRAMKGVTKVALASSEKADANGSGGGDSGGAGGDCTGGSGQRPQVNLVVFFGDGTTATTGSTTSAATTTPSTSTAGGTK